MEAIWINAAAQSVELVEYSGLPDLRRMVGGWIEHAHTWPQTGDVLYVDEEGRLKAPRVWFRMLGLPEVYAGSGVIVGREIGDTANTAPPTIDAGTVRRLVQFLASGDMLHGR